MVFRRRPVLGGVATRGWAHLTGLSAPRTLPSHTCEADEFGHLARAPASALRKRMQDEAAYVRAALRPLNGQISTLYDEMAGRLPPDLITPPEPIGDWVYYTRTAARRDLPVYCRQHMHTGKEQELLDLSALADAHGYAGLGALSISANHSMLACTLDLSGAEQWQLHVLHVGTEHHPGVRTGPFGGQILSTRARVLNAEWADGEELIYTHLDERGRPCRALIHAAGSDGSISGGSDSILFEEHDETACVLPPAKQP